jgi:hypothetical protein
LAQKEKEIAEERARQAKALEEKKRMLLLFTKPFKG